MANELFKKIQWLLVYAFFCESKKQNRLTERMKILNKEMEQKKEYIQKTQEKIDALKNGECANKVDLRHYQLQGQLHGLSKQIAEMRCAVAKRSKELQKLQKKTFCEKRKV